MTAADVVQDEAARMARAWRDARHEAVCDVVEPWAHGHVVRATRYPDYFELNIVRVEEEPGMTATELAAFADRALAGLGHRRLDLDPMESAEPLRAAFATEGWETTRILWMLHDGSPGPPAAIAVEEVPYDAVDELRAAWHREDFPDVDFALFRGQAREVSLRRGAQVLAVMDGGAPVAFAQLERLGGGAEITHVYVHPEHRGAGRGTAMTRSAIDAARDAGELWITADGDGSPQHLYERLGFRPVWTTVECWRLV